MPQNPIKPTDPEAETALGRIALWLEEPDLIWLSQHCACSDDADDQTREQCARIRFRARTALHKAGLTR